jgi:multiple sugar transport system substrate-binding protein
MRRVALAAAVCLPLGLLAACDRSAAPSPGPTPSADPATPSVQPDPVTLEVAVWGAEPELAAYRSVIATYDVATPSVRIEVATYPDSEELMSAIRAGDVPDVFLADRDDLGYLLEQGVTQPLGERLDERAVDFGDEYSRAALEAFSFDRDLQCMPYGVDPQVVYYNVDLIDFDRMARRGLDVPELDPERRTRWTLEQFQAAAEFATRPRQGSRGFHVEPTLEGIAPFLLAAGGDVYDDATSPTSLAFASEDSRAALETVLPVLRAAPLTLTDEQLAQQSPLEWFTQGRLGMIVGDRELTPLLREVEDLDFDVMPIPTISSTATTGDLTALCISARTREVAASADLLVRMISGEAVRAVVPTGYLVPAHQTVALTQDFLQGERQPERSQVFTDGVDALVVQPVLQDPDALRAAVDPAIAQLLTVGVPDLEQLTASMTD